MGKYLRFAYGFPFILKEDKIVFLCRCVHNLLAAFLCPRTHSSVRRRYELFSPFFIPCWYFSYSRRHFQLHREDYFGRLVRNKELRLSQLEIRMRWILSMQFSHFAVFSNPSWICIPSSQHVRRDSIFCIGSTYLREKAIEKRAFLMVKVLYWGKPIVCFREYGDIYFGGSVPLFLVVVNFIFQIDTFVHTSITIMFTNWISLYFLKLSPEDKIPGWVSSLFLWLGWVYQLIFYSEFAMKLMKFTYLNADISTLGKFFILVYLQKESCLRSCSHMLICILL